MTKEEYKTFLKSLGLNCLDLDSLVRPECLNIKAKLISKYYNKSGSNLGCYDEATNVLVIYTHNVVVVLIFDCPDVGLVQMSWSPTASPDNIVRKSCSLDDIINECEKTIKEIE